MSGYTYDPPPGDKFLVALRRVFAAENQTEVTEILDRCISLEISTQGQFSHRRWNEYEAHANFRTDFETIAKITDEVRRTLVQKCNTLMPEECGLGVVDVSFSPSIELLTDRQSADILIKEISELASQPESALLRVLLDPNLVEKGRELSQVYHLLFLVENCLRRFIDMVLSLAVGKDYFNKIVITQEVKKSIGSRKAQEEKHRWVRVRGDSDMFYLDFVDLGYVIKNNWTYFKEHFPDQAWIQVKIDELYRCRCLIAHNSDIGSHEIDVIKTNFKSILLQISQNRSNELPF